MMIVEAIFILIIIFNIPYIIAFVVGIIEGLIEVAAEGVNESTAENSREDNLGAEFMAGAQEPVFFKGCVTEEDLRSRYRALMKIYHPDGDHGDAEVAKRINAEYEILTKTK